MAVYRLDEIAYEARDETGVTVRHLKRVEDVELKTLEIEAGSATPFHTHTHAHEGVIVSGTGVLSLTDRSEFLAPGYVFSTNPKEPHAIENHGTEPLRLVCMDCYVD